MHETYREDVKNVRLISFAKCRFRFVIARMTCAAKKSTAGEMEIRNMTQMTVGRNKPLVEVRIK